MPEIRVRLRPLLLLLAGECGRRDLTRCAGGLGQQQRPDRPDHQADDARGEGRPALRHLRLRADRRHDRPGRRRAPTSTELGVANGKELIEKYHLGGVIYFAWSNNVANPQQIAGLSNGLQRVATAQRARTSRCSSPPTRSTASSPGSGRRPPSSRATWRSARGAATTDAYDAGADQRQGAAGDRHQPELRPRRRRQRQPAEPGHRRPLVRLRPVAGVRRSCRPASPATRTPTSSATAKHFPGHGDTATDSHFGVPIINHTRASGRASTPRRSGPRSSAASTRS